jgi:excisionase family DNA binding protein
MHPRINKLYQETLQVEALRVEEAAIVLGVGRSKVFELIRSGALASVKIDKSRRVRRRDAMEYLERLPLAEADIA